MTDEILKDIKELSVQEIEQAIGDAVQEIAPSINQREVVIESVDFLESGDVKLKLTIKNDLVGWLQRMGRDRENISNETSQHPQPGPDPLDCIVPSSPKTNK